MELVQDDLIKLGLALLLGGLVGAEREYSDKAAGFRTMILICVGSTLFTLLSLKIANTGDPARIAAQIVSGIGFLGAGAILRDTGRIRGLTTAATIWLAAALGMGIGSEQYVLAGTTTALVLVVLWAFPLIERWIGSIHRTEIYEITVPFEANQPGALEKLFQESGLRVYSCRRRKSREAIISSFEVYGKPKAHTAITDKLIDHPDVLEFKILGV